MKKKIISLLLVCMLAFSLLAACRSTENGTAAGGKTLVIRASGDPQTFNPDLTGDDYAYPIVQNIFNRLCKLDASKAIIPDLAESWDIAQDGKTITFHLRKGVKWHDGEAFDSSDVVYTMQTIQANSSYFLSQNLQNVEKFEAKDANTVVFHLKEPNVALIGYLAWYGSFIMPEHLYNTDQKWEDSPYNLKPVGTGPFKLEEFKPGVSVSLVKNADYWEAEPKLDRVVYQIIPDETTAVQALRNGEIDILENIPNAEYQSMNQNKDIRLESNIYPSPMYIVFNMKEELVRDSAVRRAFAMCIDRQEVADKVFSGVRSPEVAFYPAAVEWASNQEDTAPGFDIEGAARILEEAGYQKDSEGYYVRGLTFDVFEGGGFPDTAKLIQANAKKAGLEVILNVQEYNAWNEKVFIGRNFIVEMQGGFQGPDPSALASRVGTDGTMNQGSYSNPEVDALFLEAARVSEQQERGKLFKQIQAILAEDLPILPVVNFASYDACRADVINAPIDGTGKWGWAELTFTDFKQQ